MSAKVYSLIFAGVGGQGALLGAEVTALAAVRAGFDVKQTEVHGVSQLGGSVETHVRFGEKVWSPVVTPGAADVVIGLEKLEALRFAHFVAPGGVILVNDHEIVPGSIVGAEDLYPHNALDRLQGLGGRVVALPAAQAARDLGDGRMANLVIVGGLVALLPIPRATWIETIRERIPEKYRQANLRAFEAGEALMAQAEGGLAERSPS
jgi:indolepyruvate ferredoxin oxidoreductase beta subunit